MLVALLLAAGVVRAEPPANAITVTLEDAGAEPRTKLRHAPKTGSETTGRMTIGLTTHQTIAKRDNTTVLPDVHFDVVLAVDKALPDSIRYTITFEKITVADAPEAEAGTQRTLRSAWRKLNGSRAIVVISPRGIPESASLKLKSRPPEAISDALQELVGAIRDLQVRFPVEAVGVGARWTVTEPAQSGGVVYARKTTWTLTAREGKALRLSMTRTEQAPGGTAMNDLPDGMTATITQVGGTTSGTSTVVLTELLPLEHQRASEHELRISGKNGPKPFEMTTKANGRLTIRRGPAK